MDKRQQYGYLKAQYLEQNPDCTPMEFDAACKRFLEMLDL